MLTHHQPPLLSSLLPPHPMHTLFPYTTLFRSLPEQEPGIEQHFGTLVDDAENEVAMLCSFDVRAGRFCIRSTRSDRTIWRNRSEEHTSELRSRGHLVCRLLLEKKKEDNNY